MKIDKYTVQIALFFTIVLLLTLFYIPKKIDKSFTACICSRSRDEFFVEDIDLELKIQRSLLDINSIKGTVTINNKEYRVENGRYMDLIKGIKSKFNKESYLLWGTEYVNGETILLISFFISQDFNYILGNIKDEQLTKGKSMMIAAPANNIYEIDAIANKLHPKN